MSVIYYARTQNPTRSALEENIAALEGAERIETFNKFDTLKKQK
jgi:O-acetylhomoserine/O-acetylserine sulfhydrylase-like pyridoxal-dependent enzyme